jgi:hypothetical protein
MPFKDPVKLKEYERSRYSKRLEYWREYQRKRSKDPNIIRIKQETHKEPIFPGIAYKSEMLALSILEGSKRINRPVDLEWQGKLVDVKTAIKRVYHTGTCTGKTNYWKFYLKQLRKADLFLFILQNKDKKVERVLLVPDKVFNSKYLRIAENKLDSYSEYDITS